MTTTGRRTGKRRRRCIRAIRSGENVYIVSIGGPHAAWLKNVRANPAVGLRIRDGWFSGVVRELRDPAETQHARAVFCETVNRFDYVECMVHRKGLPTPFKIMELHRAWFEGGTPLAVTLQETLRTRR